MQVANNAAVNQVNFYSQAQAREASPAAATQVSRPQVVKTDTKDAVNVAPDNTKVDAKKPDDKLRLEQPNYAKEALQAAEEVQAKAQPKAEAPGTKRGTLVDITA